MNFTQKLSRESRDMVSRIEPYQHLLYPGVYRLYCLSARYIWKREPSFFRWLSALLRQGDLPLKKKLKLLLWRNRFRVAAAQPTACGDEIYVTRKLQLKVFSRADGVVHYFPNDAALFDRAEQFYLQYAPYLGRPVIQSVSRDAQCIVERYVTEPAAWRDDPNAILRVTAAVREGIRRYTEASRGRIVTVPAASFLREAMDSCGEDAALRQFLERLRGAVSPALDTIALLEQHNDMVLSNLLLEQDGTTVFDYEFYSRNLFYYDAMMWLVWQAVYYHEDQYLESFLRGEMDAPFSALFSAAGQTFSGALRRDYVLLFLAANIAVHNRTGDGTYLPNYIRVLDRLLGK